MCLITDTLTCFGLFSFSFSYVRLYLGLQLKLYSRGKNTHTHPQYTNCSSPWVWMLTFIPHTLRCARRNVALLCPHYSQRNPARHSCVNDAVPLHLHPCPPPSQYTNTIPQPAVWCGNFIHISCQPERFFSFFLWGALIQNGWGEILRLCLPPRKSLYGSRNRGQVWVQLGWQWEIGRGSRRSLRHDLAQCKINRKSGLKKNVEDDRIKYLPAGHCRI